MAEKWEKETPAGAELPEKVKGPRPAKKGARKGASKKPKPG
jgi:hypothetical protein